MFAKENMISSDDFVTSCLIGKHLITNNKAEECHKCRSEVNCYIRNERNEKYYDGNEKDAKQ